MGRLTNTLMVLSMQVVKRFAELGAGASIFGGFSHPFQGYIPPQVENTLAADQKSLAKERAKKKKHARDKYINYAKRK